MAPAQPKPNGGITIPAAVAWTVAAALIVHIAGGLYFAGQIVGEFRSAVQELKSVKAIATQNREVLLSSGAIKPNLNP